MSGPRSLGHWVLRKMSLRVFGPRLDKPWGNGNEEAEKKRGREGEGGREGEEMKGGLEKR